MHTRILSLMLAAMALPAMAANFSGKWAIAAPAGRGGGGRGGLTVLVLNQAGSDVTGSITVRLDPGTSSPVNTEVLGGKVEGGTLTFYVWTGTDQPAKATYTGSLSASGEEIAFTIARGQNAAGGAPQQVTAKRVK